MNILHETNMKSIIEFIFGLTIFILSIRLLSSYMENNLNNKIKNILTDFTYKKFNGLIIGIIITVIVQSSSLVIVLVIILAHSNVLDIKRALPIVLGSNIGTTFTGQITAFNVKNILPIIILSGLILYLYSMDNKYRLAGSFILCISLIFIGIELMGSSLYKVTSSNYILKNIGYVYDSKINSILFGSFFSSLIHSSSTSIVLLQLISEKEIIPLLSSIYILFGLNIGTSIDAIIAGISTNNYGRRIALFHLLFNILGVIIFFYLGDLLKSLVMILSPYNISRQIANAHTIFNITIVMLIFPFIDYISDILNPKKLGS
ncbi:Na/Pi symporter [Senegalia massiliensis]|uniref:Na/Pi cotransporter family protein n=1 Tax=Senegalia massiliensis TaxID=1720316 RepID=A0A845QRK7_9CLOT|nr:Na/Pi symporter [Senegalia massiliensis]NBI05427.1 Na/Pi cotransporter family protein [Senegalia massiliensis]